VAAYHGGVNPSGSDAAAGGTTFSRIKTATFNAKIAGLEVTVNSIRSKPLL
jgi:hypothetical protein